MQKLIYNIFIMLVDTRNKSESKGKGFNPNVQNQVLTPKAKGWMWFLIILAFIFTLGIYGAYYVSKRNWFNKMQEQINTSASNISVQLVQRRDTLVKLVDATKTHMKYEKDTLAQITQLRNINTVVDPKDFSKVNNELSKFGNRLMANFEQYPDLRASMSIGQLMNSAEINEREIAASRRLYNQDVNSFNQALFQFPSEFIAARNHLHSLPLFEASDEQTKDVNLDMRDFEEKSSKH